MLHNTMMRACINPHCRCSRVHCDIDWEVVVLIDRPRVTFDNGNSIPEQPPLRQKRIYKIEIEFFGQYYKVNFCEDCYDIMKAIESTDFKQAMMYAPMSRDGYEFMEKIIDVYYKEREGQKLVLKDMFGQKQKLLNAPVSLRSIHMDQNIREFRRPRYVWSDCLTPGDD